MVRALTPRSGGRNREDHERAGRQREARLTAFGGHALALMKKYSDPWSDRLPGAAEP